MIRENLRAFPRYGVQIDAEVYLGMEIVPARTRNVSQGGVCFVVARPISLGHELVVKMALVFADETFSDKIELKARVVWCTQLSRMRYQIGTTFIGLGGENRACLDTFLKYLSHHDTEI